MTEIFNTITKNSGKRLKAVRSKRAITILGEFPVRHIQIITRIYHSPAEVIYGFDVDCCCCFFDGSNVFGTTRFLQSLTKRYLLVNPLRRSATYETRLYKYSKRGFCVIVPGLEKPKIKSEVFESVGFGMPKCGLAKLINYDNHYRMPSFCQNRFLGLSRNMLIRLSGILHLYKTQNFETYLKFYDYANQNPSDYTDVVFPYGKTWSPNVLENIVKLSQKCFFWLTKSHKHILVSSEDIDDIIQGNASCHECPDHSAGSLGPLIWETKNCCFQDLEETFGFKRYDSVLSDNILQTSWDDPSVCYGGTPSNLNNSTAPQLPVCQYGSHCYRKNPHHFQEYSHPEGSTHFPKPQKERQWRGEMSIYKSRSPKIYLGPRRDMVRKARYTVIVEPLSKRVPSYRRAMKGTPVPKSNIPMVYTLVPATQRLKRVQRPPIFYLHKV